MQNGGHTPPNNGHPCYGQLTPVKTRYSLMTSITWPYHGLKFTAYQGHMCSDVDRWPSAGFRLDRWLISGWLVVNRARLFSSQLMLTQDYKKVNQVYIFSCIQINVFHCLCFLYYEDLEITHTQNRIQRPNNINRNLTIKLQNQNQNSHLFWSSSVFYAWLNLYILMNWISQCIDTVNYWLLEASQKTDASFKNCVVSKLFLHCTV